jgi:hypothetical protein
MAVNTYVPTTSSRTPTYVTPRPITDAQGRQQSTSGYEWLDYGTFVPGAGTTRWRTNPPFASWEAGGHNIPFYKGAAGGPAPANIKRGYIRRALVNAADIPSQCRLYFMYNPTTITRQYVNYLDQGALDPFNTLFDSGNLVAPPSILEFNFELFFDRQTEAMQPGNRGVLDDMDYFDLVVRNVIPGGTGANNTLPDSGVMMVNPRDVTVVFSKDITVQGRPVNSQIIYEKFTHEMTPTRMRIALTMRVIYMGPVRDIGTFSSETVNVDRTIPYDIPPAPEFNFTFHELEWPSNNEDAERPSSVVLNSDGTLVSEGNALSNEHTIGGRAADNAKYQSDRAHTKYVGANGARNALWGSADCSSFVWAGFVSLEPDGDIIASNLGWSKFEDGKRSGNIVSTAGMKGTFGSNPYVERLWGFGQPKGELDSAKIFDTIMKSGIKGDILLRHLHPDDPSPETGHVAFLWSKGDNSFSVLHAASPSQDVTISTYSKNSIQYNYGIRVYATSGNHFADGTKPGSDPTVDLGT